MASLRFVCSGAEPFDLFGIPAWAERQLSGGSGVTEVEIEVVHPDREAEGSCRWCACRRNEVVLVREGRLA